MGKRARENVAQGSRFSPSADGRLFHRDACWAAGRETLPLEEPSAIKIGGRAPAGPALPSAHGFDVRGNVESQSIGKETI
jgi:hypothetical protein